MLSRLTLLACLLVYLPQNLFAVEDLIFYSGFEQSGSLAAPSGLSALASSSTSIDLTWTDNTSTESGFTIEYSQDGSNWLAEADVSADVTTYSDSGLIPATTYYYRVLAFDSGTNSAWSNVSSATTSQSDPTQWVDYVAFGDSYGAGEVFGTYLKTHVDDGDFQQFTEKVSGGKQKDQTTFMGHLWRFDIGSGDSITVHANAWQSVSSDGDNFVFSWSDDNINYTDMFIVSSQSTLNMDSGTIPNSVSGPVWIRVIDTERTPGNFRSRDSLFVDHLYIRVTQTGPP